MGSKIEEILNKEEILKVIKTNLKHDNFTLKDVIVKPAGENPLGFNGEHAKITVTVIINNQNTDLHYFVKKTPNAVQAHREYLDKAKCFYKEIGLFKSLLIDLTNARKFYKRVEKWYPECYYYKNEDIIVFEDVSVDGYYMVPERTFLDEDYILKCLDSISAMHASSIIFEEKLKIGEIRTISENRGSNLKSIGELYNNLLFETEATGDKNHPGNWVYETGIKAFVELVDLLPKYTTDQKIIIKKKLPNEMRRIYDLVKPSDRFRNVLVHADLWTNNFLFKNDNKNKVEHALIIDFQIARYAPPAHDVSMFFHLVQNKKFRDVYKSKLLNYYYEALTEELELNGLKINSLLPWDEFQESYDYYEELAILTALFYFQMILAPGEFASKFLSSSEIYTQTMFVSRNDMVKECYLTDDIYRTRVTEEMDELIWKYILI